MKSRNNWRRSFDETVWVIMIFLLCFIFEATELVTRRISRESDCSLSYFGRDANGRTNFELSFFYFDTNNNWISFCENAIR